MEKATSLAVALLVVLCWVGPVVEARNKFFPSPPAEAPGTTHSQSTLCTDKLHPMGYKCEDHTVKTADGYHIRVARIPTGRSDTTESTSKVKPAVLLQHGVMCDGATFLLLKENSLATFLADSGFDVWISNNRGTKYSLGHESLDPSQREYWDWSWDDLSTFEIPALVNHVKNQTGHSKIHYIGHSMGTLQVLAALADRMPVTHSFLSVVLLSPIGHLNHITSPVASVAANIFLAETGKFIGLPHFNVLEKPVAELCRRACELPGVDCSNFLNSFTGQNCCIEPEAVDAYLEHEPQTTSIKVLVHLSQNVRNGVISRFDYGNSKDNKNHYGHAQPPVFNMSNISPSIPLYVAYGGLDSLADFVDVELLLRSLQFHDKSKITKKFTLEYAHMDYLMAYDAKQVVYEPLIPFLKHHCT